MGKIITVCNHKGGVGKMTTCVNLAAALGVLEKKVLVIDTDPQTNASMSFGFSSKRLNNPVLEKMDFTNVIKNNISKTSSPNVDLIPFIEDVNFFEQPTETSKFKKALDIINAYYDYIILDCVPFFKVKNLDILVASHSVIIPVQCDYYALEGLHTFLKTILYVQKKLNPSLEIEGFLLTMFDNRLNLSKEVVNYTKSNFKELVFNTIINRNSQVVQAQSFGKSIIEFDINSTGANDYLQLANEIIANHTLNKEPKNKGLLPTEEESFFNNKKFAELGIVKEEDAKVFDKFFQKNTDRINDHKKSVFPKNLDRLIGLRKHDIENKLGSCNEDFYGNIWMYKINQSNLFKKKYLYIHFDNNIVSHYDTRWFKHNYSL